MAAALADIFKGRGQDVRVVKVSDLGEVLMFSRGIKSNHKSCPPEKTTWYVNGRVKSRLRFYVAAALADLFWGQDGRMVKVSGLAEVLMFSRGIKSDHKSCPPRRPHGKSMVDLNRDCDSM